MRKQFGFLAALCVVAHSAAAKGAFEVYGDIAQFAIPLVAAGYSWQQDDDEGLKQFGYALLSTEATVQLLKHTVDATRPDGGHTVSPSGHTALAFSDASYLQMRYGWKYGAPAYIAAGAVGWSRVESGHHYWRDVFAGAAIATGFSYIFTSPNQQHFALYPLILDDKSRGFGFHLTY